MFQYAMARSLADQNGQELLLDLQYLEQSQPARDFTLRSYELSNFRIRAAIATSAQLKKIVGYARNKFDFYKRLFLSSVCGIKYINEHDFSFSSIKVSSDKINYITGFWQSEAYFLENALLIKSDFQLIGELNEVNRSTLSTIDSCEAISVHIRRGDYVDNPNHPVCDLSYYEQAFNVMKNQVKDGVFFVFSDDIHWVKENLKIDTTMLCVDINADESSYLDMYLMSKCKHHIIANSTFSWWAAWLGENPQKNVIAPKYWFCNSEINTNDLIPDNWTRI